MAVRIRLQRHGRKKRPFYRVVVADSRRQRDGRFIEKLGYYDPLTDPATVVIDEEKALKWLKEGAQPSDTAKRLLSKTGILEKFTYIRMGKSIPRSETDESSAPPPTAPDEDAKAAETAEGTSSSTEN